MPRIFTVHTPCEVCGADIKIETEETAGARIGVQCDNCGSSFTAEWDFSLLMNAMDAATDHELQEPSFIPLRRRAIYTGTQSVDRTSMDGIG